MEKYPNVVVPDHGRGFFGIGIYGLRTTANLGTLWRSAQIMKADFLFVIGKRYQTMRTDTMKSWKHIPLFEYDTLDQFFASLPKVGRETNRMFPPTRCLFPVAYL